MIGVSSNDLGLVSTSIILISENLKVLIPNLETFARYAKMKDIPIRMIRSQYKSMVDNTLLWWAEQTNEIQIDLLERCLKMRYKQQKRQHEFEHGQLQS